MALEDRRRRTSAGSCPASGEDYDAPEAFLNLNESAVSPIEPPNLQQQQHDHNSLEEVRSHGHSHKAGHSSEPSNSNLLGEYANLNELALSPVESRSTRRLSLEQVRSYARSQTADPSSSRHGSGALNRGSQPGLAEEEATEVEDKSSRASRMATQLYTVSYLILFSIWGTLARLGLQALTTYPGAPVAITSIWPNFAGCLVMGYLAEDCRLFRLHDASKAEQDRSVEIGINGSMDSNTRRTPADREAEKKAHLAMKKTIPAYIGLATGFCGSFTSFSSFIRDSFLALANDVPVPGGGVITPRHGGYSFMALLAVIIMTVALSLAGLFLGAHLALATEAITPSLPRRFTRKVVDRAAIALAWGCWLGAIVLAALPPDRSGPGPSAWRGRALFALVFAPLGCLLRFYASVHLNGRIASFPLGTFAVNVAGTAVLGLCWDLQHAPLGGVVGCQALQGLQDGFCGCLTTVSTWAAELAALRRRHAYLYGLASVGAGLGVLVVVMGGLRWTQGFAEVLCVH